MFNWQWNDLSQICEAAEPDSKKSQTIFFTFDHLIKDPDGKRTLALFYD